jgi:tRNA(His) 5'-end guanylyltransferase
MKDPLGSRLKENYENRTQYYLPRRTYVILRLDGKAWHTYTANLIKPFDQTLSMDLVMATTETLKEIQGAAFAYVQSDEVSILVTDFSRPETSAWYDNNLQKMVSVTASILTAEFNNRRIGQKSLSYFDCRAFSIPDPTEVLNYFRWRNQDAQRNSVAMQAQSQFNHNDLQGVSTVHMMRMLDEKGQGWGDLASWKKFGWVVRKDVETDLNTGMEHAYWMQEPAWKFVGDGNKLLKLIPTYQ